jgi:hypothetical protein
MWCTLSSGKGVLFTASGVDVVSYSGTADLGTSPEHQPTLEAAASSSLDFRHSTALGPGSKGRLGVQLHSQAREDSKLEHQHLVLDDEGYEGATSSMLTIYAL